MFVLKPNVDSTLGFSGQIVQFLGEKNCQKFGFKIKISQFLKFKVKMFVLRTKLVML